MVTDFKVLIIYWSRVNQCLVQENVIDNKYLECDYINWKF